MKIKVHTSFVGRTGYNAHSRDFFTALSKLEDITLKIRNFTCGDSWQGLGDDPHEGETYLTEYQKHLMGEQTVINNEGNFYDTEIYDGMSDVQDYDIDLVLNETNHHYYYDFDKFKGKFKIAYNVWESTRQPEDFFNHLLKFDQLWVPSEWQKKVSIEQGFPKERVFVVPEAVESKIFFPDKNRNILDEYNDNRFKFIIFGRWDYRKSTKELIQTFLKTFTKNEPVDLIMSIDNPYSVDGLKTTQDRLDKHGFNDKRIKVLNFLNREDYIDYLKNGHVFLSCARSEGWNLPLIEALACGTPSIYSDWGAQLQFSYDKGHPVKVIGERPVGNGETYGLGKPRSDGSVIKFSNISVPGNYCEPDFNDLSKVMRDVYTNYWEYKGKAIRDSKLVIDEFSWENAAIKAKKILNDIYVNLLIDSKPKQEFVFFTGGDEKYLPIVEGCVKSLNKFSNIPIIVYGFNCDVSFNYTNMTKKRINKVRDKKFDDRDTRLYYNKIDASLDCLESDNTKTYIWIDGDCVVTPNIDSIIQYKKQIDKYPLCMRYKHENLFHRKTTSTNGYSEKGHGQELGEIFNIDRNNNFTIATGLYMFDIRSKWFFEEVLFHHTYLLNNVNAINCVDDMALAEERLFNVLFWKYKFKKYLTITWVSNTYFKFENKNIFTPKIENYIKSGFDIMFDYDNTDPLKNNLKDESKILFYHGQRDISKIENLLNKLETNKLMIVAHPDDETIFGGGMLLNEDGWKVVVVTDGSGDNNDSNIRLKEFESVIQHLGTKYQMLGFKDDMNNVLYDENEVESKLREIILSKNWNKIITHNENGEYGHIIHKSVHNIVKKINPNNLHFFKKSQFKLNEKLYKRKNMLLDFYKSQNTDLSSFKEYLIYEGITENKNELFKDNVELVNSPNIIYNFKDLSAFIDIRDTIENEYYVEFLDYDTNKSIYGVNIKTNHWAATKKMLAQKKWLIKISNNNNIIFEHIFNFENRNVKFILNGEYEKVKNDLDVINKLIDKYNISVFVTTKYDEFKKLYPKVIFAERMEMVYYAQYNFKENDNLNKIFGRWLK